eukprot:Em0009g325a
MDYRRARGYTVVLLCSDTGGLTNTSTVYVTITSPPNYSPLAFSSDSYVFNVSRTTPPLYIIGQIMATDEIIWSTTLAYSQQSNPYFIIDSLNGTIQTISSVFDYPYSEIVLNATVTDGLFNDTVAVHIVLTPGNLNSPVFTPGERSFDINELSPIGTSVATFQCTDADNGTNGQISYFITGGNIDGAFQINQLTGVVQLANLLILPQNLASYPYQLTIQCSDHGVPKKSNVTLAYFNVYQDNALKNFTSGFIAFVNENANINDTVITINATFHYPSKYSFINESLPNVFTIDANTGVVRVAAHLDHDTVPVYTMTVVAMRSVYPARNSSALLTIYVRAVNKYRPKCMSIFNPTILDSAAVGSTVLQLSCSDADTGINGAIVCSLSMNYGVLGVNTITGAIYISSLLDSISYSVLNLTVLGLNYANATQYQLIINVSDPFPVPRIISITVYIFVQPVNTFSPVFQQSLYSYTIPENSPIGVTDHDSPASPDGQVTYSLIGLNQPKFTIDRSGWIILASNLDILQQAVYNFTVLAMDGGKPPRTGSASMVIYVGYVGIRPPQFTQSLYYTALNITNPSTLVGSVVLTVHCTDPVLGNTAPIYYSLDPSLSSSRYFNVDPNSSAPYNLSDTAVVDIQLLVKSNITFTPSASCLFLPPHTYNCTLPERVQPVYTILQVNATSPGGYAIIYSLINYQTTFSIDPSSGYFRLIGMLEYEQQQVYVITIQASLVGPLGSDIALATVLVPIITIPNINICTITSPIITITSPIITITSHIITITSPIIIITSHIITITSPIITITSPFITITSPIITITSPIITVTSPIITITSHIITINSPIITITSHIITITSPIITITSHIITITSHIITITSPIITITSPIITITSPIITITSHIITITSSIITITSHIITILIINICTITSHILPPSKHHPSSANYDIHCCWDHCSCCACGGRSNLNNVNIDMEKA